MSVEPPPLSGEEWRRLMLARLDCERLADAVADDESWVWKGLVEDDEP